MGKTLEWEGSVLGAVAEGHELRGQEDGGDDLSGLLFKLSD